MEIAGILGIYGAIVSTSLLVWNIVKDRPKVQLKIRPVWSLSENGIFCKEVEYIVINKGRDPIRVEEIGFDVFCSEPLFFESISFHPSHFDIPEKFVLEGRSKRVVRIGIEELRNQADGMSVEYYWVKDATDSIYRKRVQKKLKPILDFEHKAL
jgi:hypothetical protein